MARDRDEETGRFAQEFPQERFMRAVETLDMATTSRVAAEVGCSYDLAYRRLNEFSEKGEIEKISVGSSFMWKRT